MLHPSHVKLLKKIENHKIVRCERNHKDLDYLYEQGYIEMTICDKPGDYFAQPYITEKGKARLYDEYRKFVEVWLPVAISTLLSVAALTISIIALMK